MYSLRKRLIYFGGSALLIIAAGVVTALAILSSGRVSIDTASVQAPIINLTAAQSGLLSAVYVQPGDMVSANEPVANVGNQIITSKVAGLIVQVSDTLGAQIAPGVAVAEMIDPSQLRVVGRIDENKGLAQIQVGDPATFTVDAFGSQTFTGVIDEISPTAHQSGILFNISSERQVQQFDVKIRFDASAYPQIKNGMSARMRIYTQ